MLAGPNLKIFNDFGQSPVFFASKSLIQQRGLGKYDVTRINVNDLNDAQKLKLDPRIVQKLQEAETKVQNHRQML